MSESFEQLATEEDMNKPDYGSNPGTPRWVKVSGVISLLLVLLFVILHLTGNSFGGLGHHMH
ncbi:hypothetical protein JJB07_02865 [Tumebacillus sp. ITR2]|uniref:Uncharacterized protein n=1 Tax=Tumebacillus amylolyticus TaxID=2801339 RepID=A0ABS1J5M0_9BACL|nr:hypothetical protein [Tumebacillus amylolyticus]MBL0385581.1 hypothetical protein [Tumebacillus amylolyticus]